MEKSSVPLRRRAEIKNDSFKNKYKFAPHLMLKKVVVFLIKSSMTSLYVSQLKNLCLPVMSVI